MRRWHPPDGGAQHIGDIDTQLSADKRPLWRLGHQLRADLAGHSILSISDIDLAGDWRCFRPFVPDAADNGSTIAAQASGLPCAQCAPGLRGHAHGSFSALDREASALHHVNSLHVAHTHHVPGHALPFDTHPHAEPAAPVSR